MYGFARLVTSAPSACRYRCAARGAAVQGHLLDSSLA
jgi:hypothetical protein